MLSTLNHRRSRTTSSGQAILAKAELTFMAFYGAEIRKNPGNAAPWVQSSFGHHWIKSTDSINVYAAILTKSKLGSEFGTIYLFCRNLARIFHSPTGAPGSAFYSKKFGFGQGSVKQVQLQMAITSSTKAISYQSNQSSLAQLTLPFSNPVAYDYHYWKPVFRQTQVWAFPLN